MDNGEFELILERLLGNGPLRGDEAFRDSLLERCLAELGADGDCAPLDDDILDLLAAAGDLAARRPDEP